MASALEPAKAVPREHHHRHGSRGHEEHAHPHEQEERAHEHASRSTPASRLTVALALTAGFMFVEAAAGALSGSLALLSDAGHMLSDAGALALALAAQRMAERPRTRARTFGFRRTETLAALANATALTASAALICAEAIRRLLEGGSQVSEGRAVLGVAAAGLGVNLVSAWVLSRGGETRSVNVRAALAHVLSDAAGSLAAIVAGLAIVLFEAHWCDPASSLFIAGLVALASFRLLRQVTHVLMEGAPVGLDVSALETTIRTTAGVADLHDLHAWTIEEGFDAVTVHVVIESGAHGVEVAREVSRRIRRVHGVEHITVQPEAPSDPPLVPVSSLTRKTEERGQISKGTR